MILNILLLLTGSLLSPYSLITGVFIIIIWVVLSKAFGRERAFVVVWTGMLLFWILMLVSYVVFAKMTPAINVLMGVPLPMHLSSTNSLETTLSDVEKENILPFFLDYITALGAALLISKTLTSRLTSEGKFNALYYSVVGGAMVASIIGTFFFIVAVS